MVLGTQTFWCGGPVRGLAWAPGRNRECYVAVATDRSMDGYYKEDMHYKHKGIIQIWSVGCLRDKEYVLFECLVLNVLFLCF